MESARSGRSVAPWRALAAGGALAMLIFPIALVDVARLNATVNDWPFVLWAVTYSAPFAVVFLRPQLAALLLALPHSAQLIFIDNWLWINLTVPVMLFVLTAMLPAAVARRWVGLAMLAAVIGACDWSMAPSDEPAASVAEIAGRIGGYAAMTGAVILTASFLGLLIRTREEQAAAAREKARLLEREHAHIAQLAAAQERTRIARDMHDTVAHALSVISIQADGALFRMTLLNAEQADHSAAAQAVATIKATAQESLLELRSLVGALRSGGGADYRPQPGLSDLPALVRRMQDSTITVTLDSHDTLENSADVPRPTQVAAYRIVQEAVTNAMKHAGRDATIAVTVRRGPTDLTLHIRDNGNGPQRSDGHGHGIVGMRERAASVGGRVSAHEDLAGGFEVVAHLPIVVGERAE